MRSYCTRTIEFYLLVIVLISLPKSVLADGNDGVVVWKLDGKAGVEETQIDSVSGYLSAEVERLTGLDVISEADVSTILKGEETRQRCGSDQPSCLAEIGAALGVPLAVSGDLGRLGDYWLVNLRLVDARNVKVLARVGRKIEGELEDVIDAIPAAVMELFDIEHQPEPTSSLARIMAYSSIGSGVVLIGLGGIGTWQSSVAEDDVNDARRHNEESGDAENRHTAWQAIEISGYAVGSAAVTAGIVLWVLDVVRPDLTANIDPLAAIAPMPDGRGMTVTLQW